MAGNQRIIKNGIPTSKRLASTISYEGEEKVNHVNHASASKGLETKR